MRILGCICALYSAAFWIMAFCGTLIVEEGKSAPPFAFGAILGILFLVATIACFKRANNLEVAKIKQFYTLQRENIELKNENTNLTVINTELNKKISSIKMTYMSVTCPFCGGVNKAYGKSCKCEYCDSVFAIQNT